MENTVRVLTLVAMAGTLSVSGYYRHRARRATGTIARTQEGAGLIAARLLVALPLFLSVVFYVVRPGWMDWASLELPPAIRWLGAFMALGCIPLAYAVFSNLGDNVSETVLTKSDHRLVTTGPYRWVRHPLYTTGLTLFAGVGLMNESWFVLALTILTWLGVLFVVIPREEAQLSDRFGEDYRDLIRRTGRLLPRLRPGISARARRS